MEGIQHVILRFHAYLVIENCKHNSYEMTLCRKYMSYRILELTEQMFICGTLDNFGVHTHNLDQVSANCTTIIQSMCARVFIP